ncbi:MAG: sigma-70 family RNA polymerase sigma factor [Planctomycetes bacterium]|nr:sigma-70 family RNA polymerase sigma factor [Planctomycetota bacterium]
MGRDPTDESEELLFQKARRGDGAAWAKLAGLWLPRLCGLYCGRFRRTGPAAVEECVEEVLLRIYLRIAEFPTARAAVAYLRTSVRFQLLGRRSHPSLELLEEQGFDVQDPASSEGEGEGEGEGEVYELVHEFRKGLDEAKRHIFDAWLEGEPSVGELAKRLSLSERTVKRHRRDLMLRRRSYLRKRGLASEPET